MQGTRVQSLVQEDPTCQGAAKPMCRTTPTLLRGSTVRCFPALSASTRAPDSLFPVPFPCLPVSISGKTQGLDGPLALPYGLPTPRRLVSCHPPFAQSADTKEFPRLFSPARMFFPRCEPASLSDLPPVPA